MVAANSKFGSTVVELSHTILSFIFSYSRFSKIPKVKRKNRSRIMNNLKISVHENGVVIGNTQLIRINCLSNAAGCEIYGKAEFLNPGGAVKGLCCGSHH